MNRLGFVPNMPEQEYHNGPEISKSGLDKIEMSPAHYRHAPPREPTPAMLIGTAIHLAILEPDRFDAEYHITSAQDRRQAAYKEAVEQYGVDRVLLPHDAEHVRALQGVVLGHTKARKLAHAKGHAELSAFAKDPVTGVMVRCRYDRLADAGFAVDLKKARDVLPRGFANSCARYRYHVQDALYSDMYYWITGERLDEFWFLAIEDQPPYTVIPYRLDDLSIEAGRIAYRRNLNTYAECLAADSWPHYEPESELLSVPDWALGDLEELEMI
jgi:hypothetical protein